MNRELQSVKDKLKVIAKKKAVEKTFQKRNFKSDLLECLNVVKNSKVLKTYWTHYTRKNKYIKNIS